MVVIFINSSLNSALQNISLRVPVGTFLGGMVTGSSYETTVSFELSEYRTVNVEKDKFRTCKSPAFPSCVMVQHMRASGSISKKEKDLKTCHVFILHCSGQGSGNKRTLER